MKNGNMTKDTITVAVLYGNISAPHDVANSISVTMLKKNKPGCVTPNQADYFFTGSRCLAQITVDPNASTEGANTDELFENAEERIEAVVRITHAKLAERHVHIKLSISVEEAPYEALMRFRKQRGYMRLKRIEDIDPDAEAMPEREETDGE